jgi:predicted metal-dependent hydrolase
VLGKEEQALLAKGVAQFEGRLFFECHDTLEELWSSVRGPSRDFFQGLIQAAVGFYHLGNGNREGARRLFERALGRLERYPMRYAGVDAGPLREGVARFRDALASGGGLPAEPPPLPLITAQVTAPRARRTTP